METKREILTKKYALIYAVGIFGVQLFIGFMNSFQTEFYNKMYSAFDSNIIYASAVIIFIAKLISCFADPLIGALIDKSNLKGGKMRPWVLRSSIPLAVLTTVIFIYIPFKSKLLLYAYITFTTVLWNISMSFADIPSQGMLSLLSPDAEERNVAAGFSNIGKSIALVSPGIFVTIVMMVLNAVKGEGNYPDSEYYLVSVLLVLALGTICCLLMYFKNREAVPSSNSSSTISMSEMVTELKQNKMILIVFLIYILGFARGIASIVLAQANGALIGKVNIFGLTMDTTADAIWLPGLPGGIMGMVGLFIVPIVNKKLGEKKTYIYFSLATFIITMGCSIFYWCLPADSALRYGNQALIMVMIMQFIGAFTMSVNSYIPLVMTADIVDYEYWKTGKRKEGVNFAILSMAIKLSNAICVVAGLLLVAASGYTQVVYETGHIPVRMQNIAIFAYVGFIGVSALFSAIPMLFYKIDFKAKKEMHKALNEQAQ